MVSEAMRLKQILANKYRYYYARKVADEKINTLTKEIASIGDEYAEEILKFWSKYEKKINLKWFNFYENANGIKDVRYIPDDIFYQKIYYKYSEIEFAPGLEDKAYHDLLFKELARPKTFFRNINGILLDKNYNIINLKEAMDILRNQEKVVVKPTIESGGGKNVALICRGDNVDFEKQLGEKLDMMGQNYIVQEVVKQHQKLAEIHKNSVNTIRVLSFLYKGKVIILSAALRMGAGDSFVDNQCAGGFTCGINLDGKLKDRIYDHNGKAVTRHPQGFVPCGESIPSYDGVINAIKSAHPRIAHFGFVGWDFTVGEDGTPIFIEHNLGAPAIDFMQWCNGPLFGDMTEEILKEVYGNL